MIHTECKLCYCPNCMAGYEAEAYKYAWERAGQFQESALAPKYYGAIADDGFGNWVAGIIIVAGCVFVIMEFLLPSTL